MVDLQENFANFVQINRVEFSIIGVISTSITYRFNIEIIIIILGSIVFDWKPREMRI